MDNKKTDLINPFAPINRNKKQIGNGIGYKPNLQDSPDLSFASNDEDNENHKSSQRKRN